MWFIFIFFDPQIREMPCGSIHSLMRCLKTNAKHSGSRWFMTICWCRGRERWKSEATQLTFLSHDAWNLKRDLQISRRTKIETQLAEWCSGGKRHKSVFLAFIAIAKFKRPAGHYSRRQRIEFQDELRAQVDGISFVCQQQRGSSSAQMLNCTFAHHKKHFKSSAVCDSRFGVPRISPPSSPSQQAAKVNEFDYLYENKHTKKSMHIHIRNADTVSAVISASKASSQTTTRKI